MNTFKTMSIALISFALLGLQGCVSITSQSDPDKSAFLSNSTVSQSHKLYHGVTVSETEGFKGTNPLSFTSTVSPNLDNESAKEVLEISLDSAGMLANSESSARYALSAKMVDSGAYGAFSTKTTFTDITRTMTIEYVLTQISNALNIYDESITSSGTATGFKVLFYAKEKDASEKAYNANTEKLISNLKAVK